MWYYAIKFITESRGYIVHTNLKLQHVGFVTQTFPSVYGSPFLLCSKKSISMKLYDKVADNIKNVW